MPMAPPRACNTCGQAGCTGHVRPQTMWDHDHPAQRIRGRRLQQLRYALLRKQPLCALCGQPLDATFIRDHIVSLGEGGQDIDSNTQALCPRCDARKSQAEAQRGRHR